jgi:Leucine-rich repeat (LRR) protein
MRTTNRFTPFLIALLVVIALLCHAEDKVLTSVEDALKNPETVEKLDLSGKGLWQLPEGVSKLVNLKSLNLSSNDLEVLSPQIGELRNLEVLDLTGNPIRCLPVEMKQLAKLKSFAYKPELNFADMGRNVNFGRGRGGVADPFAMQAVRQRMMIQQGGMNVQFRGGRNVMAGEGDPMTIRLSSPEECEMFRSQIPDISCKVSIGTRQNMASVTLDESTASKADMLLHLQKAESPEIGTMKVNSLILEEGKHELVVWCRLKSNPFFYKLIHRQIFDVSGNLEDTVTELIAQLGAATFKQRRQAEQELVSYGEAITPYVRQARNHRDPEISMRAADILEKLDEADKK